MQNTADENCLTVEMLDDTFANLRIEEENFFYDLQLFLEVFAVGSIPNSSTAKQWIADGTNDQEQEERKKKVQYRDQYCSFQRKFIEPINNYISKSNGDLRCSNADKKTILEEAVGFIHSIFFDGRRCYYLNIGSKKAYFFPDLATVTKRPLTYMKNSEYCHRNYVMKKQAKIDGTNCNNEEQIKPPESRFINIMIQQLFAFYLLPIKLLLLIIICIMCFYSYLLLQ